MVDDTPEGTPQIRVLHIVGGLDRAGVESWLVQSLPLLRARGIQSDFVVHSARSWELESAVDAAGSAIIVCKRKAGVIRYALQIWRVLRRGRYDIVHSHVSSFGLVPLLVARMCGVRHRIYQSHSAFPALTPLRGLRAEAVKRCVPLVATRLLAVSRTAGVAAFGDGRRFDILAPGVDLDQFSRARRQRPSNLQGRPRAEITVGHVGRFEPEKNHEFLLQVAAEAARRGRPWRFELVGSGRLMNELMQTARRHELSNVSFEGGSNVVHDLVARWDLFVFPSLHEGLGLAMIEAQAAGLRCVASPHVPPEATLIEGSVVHEVLDPQVWVSRMEELLARPSVDGRALARAVASSAFQLNNSAENLGRLYTDLRRTEVGVDPNLLVRRKVGPRLPLRLRSILGTAYSDLVRRRSVVRVVQASPIEPVANPIFLIGLYRSGTTLLRYVVDSHSNIACPPESDFIDPLSGLLEEPFVSSLGYMGFDRKHVVTRVRSEISYYFMNYAASMGKSRWADKSPRYARHPERLLEIFPSAEFVIIHRHPLDQIHSMTQGGSLEPAGYAEAGFAGDGDVRIRGALYWAQITTSLIDFAAQSGAHTLRYEDLCREPEATARAVFAAVHEPWEPDVLAYWLYKHDYGKESSKVRGTKGFMLSTGGYLDWPEDVVRQVWDIAGPVARRLGYGPRV